MEEDIPPALLTELPTVISSLEPTRESLIAPGLKESIADVVFRCFTKDGKQGSILHRL